MATRDNLLSALEAVTAARREAQVGLDAEQSARLTSPDDKSDETSLQTAASLVRQLDTAAREIANGVRTYDLLARVTQVA